MISGLIPYLLAAIDFEVSVALSCCVNSFCAEVTLAAITSLPSIRVGLESEPMNEFET